MKQFITSGIFRRIFILAALATGTLFITFADSARATGDACCSFCNPIWTYCAQFSYPNKDHENEWECIVEQGGTNCEVCNPTC